MHVAVCMCMVMYVSEHVPCCVHRGQKTTCQVSPSTMWVFVDIGLYLWGLALSRVTNSHGNKFFTKNSPCIYD